MIDYKVIEFKGFWNEMSVKLVHKFRLLHKLPQCWKEITMCTTPHNDYESGITKIYQSQTTNKYYMTRYFDGCSNQMYAEVVGVDWCALQEIYEQQNKEHNALYQLVRKGEISDDKYIAEYGQLREKTKRLIFGLIG